MKAQSLLNARKILFLSPSTSENDMFDKPKLILDPNFDGLIDN